MAYNLDAVLASTHARIEKKFQDNLSTKTPMFMKFAEKEGKVLIDGGKELKFPVKVILPFLRVISNCTTRISVNIQKWTRPKRENDGTTLERLTRATESRLDIQSGLAK